MQCPVSSDENVSEVSGAEVGHQVGGTRFAVVENGVLWNVAQQGYDSESRKEAVTRAAISLFSFFFCIFLSSLLSLHFLQGFSIAK